MRIGGFAGLALAASLHLAACEIPTIQIDEPEAQAAPVVVAQPPAVKLEELTPPPEPIRPVQLSATQRLLPVGFTPSARVALLLPLSGPRAGVGEALLNAAQLAIFDVADKNFALIVRDTRGTSDGAVEAARAALDEGANLILGPLFAASVAAVAPMAQRQGVVVIGLSNDIRVAGGNVFIMGHTPGAQVQRMIDYASRQGLRRFAVLAPDTGYGDAVVQAVRTAVSRNGAELARVVVYNADSRDVTPEIRSLAQYDVRREALVIQRRQLAARGDEASILALKRLEGLDTLGNPDFDAIVLPANSKSVLAVAPSLAYYDVDPAEVRYLGTSLWDDTDLLSEPALAGGWFPAPPPGPWTAFKARFEKAYGVEPPRVASLAYDATALAALLGRNPAAGVARYDLRSITQPSGFAGVDGIIRFLPNGSNQRGLAILEIGAGGFSERDPAPRSFERLGF